MRVGIAAIVKNEAPYLREWIAFHREIGVTDFFIADNGSTDGTEELLTDLARKKHIVRLRVLGIAKQVPAYNHILSKFGERCDWLAFIDADEFLLPESGSIAAYLETLTDKAIGAVTVSWAVYGSSGHETRTEGLVIERFTRRGRQQAIRNRLCKSIVRPHAIEKVLGAHRALLKEGFIEVTSDGVPTDPSVPLMKRPPVWVGIRLNHYVIKSREEFITNKQPRGMADRDVRRGDGFFKAHDLNYVSDPMPARLVVATKKRMIRQARWRPWARWL